MEQSSGWLPARPDLNLNLVPTRVGRWPLTSYSMLGFTTSELRLIGPMALACCGLKYNIACGVPGTQQQRKDIVVAKAWESDRPCSKFQVSGSLAV